MEKSDVSRLLKGQIKDAGEKDGRKIYNIVCHEERQKEKQDFRVFSIGRSQPANPSLGTKYMMLLEETGAEKTSFINTVLNYLFGVKFEDPFRLEVEEKIEDGHLETGSRTDIKTVYTVHYQEGMKHRYNFVLIVAPGVADMRGQEQQVIMQRLETFLTYFGVKKLNCFGIISKGNINTIIHKNWTDEIKLFLEKEYPDITEVSATYEYDTVIFDAESSDTNISFRIILMYDNDCLLCPTHNQWKEVTEKYDTFIRAFITPPPLNLEGVPHEHCCKICNKICWTCTENICNDFSTANIVLTAGSVVLGVGIGLFALFAKKSLQKVPLAAAAAVSVGGGLLQEGFKRSIPLVGSVGKKCIDSSCNHPVSKHVKKQIESKKRTQDNEIIDEDIKKKRRKLSP